MKRLEITTRIGCKNRCKYCPQDKLIKKYSKISNIFNMGFNTFKKCLDKLPKNILITFSGFCEPFLNPKCIKMILYANQKGFEIRINTTCVGLTIEDIDLIKDIPFELFYVHLPDNAGLTNIKVNQHYLDVIKYILKSEISHSTFIYKKTSEGDVGPHPYLKDIFEEKT